MGRVHPTESVGELIANGPSVDDHDLDECETSPVLRIEIVEPPDVVHTRLACDRGGIQIWAQPDDQEDT